MDLSKAKHSLSLPQHRGHCQHCPAHRLRKQLLTCPSLQPLGAGGHATSRSHSPALQMSQPGITCCPQGVLSQSISQLGCPAIQQDTFSRIGAPLLGLSLSSSWRHLTGSPVLPARVLQATCNGQTSPGDECTALWALCNAVEAAFFELCVSNAGRPAAQALLSFVEAAVEAHSCGYSLRAMLLELSLAASLPSPDHLDGWPTHAQAGTAEIPSSSTSSTSTSTSTSTTSSSATIGTSDSSSNDTSSHPSNSSSGVTARGSSEFRLTSAGYRLTSSEQGYRDQWLQLVFLTLSRLRILSGAQRAANEQAQAQAQAQAGTGDLFQAAPRSTEHSSLDGFETGAEDGYEMGGLVGGDAPEWMVSIVDRVIMGQATGEEQSAVRFDRALATGGASGGVAAEKVVIAPQWVPATQLVLLTMKVQAQRQQQQQQR